MYLRQILLKNFLEILEDVSLICGELTANQLLLHLYDEKSLDEQYKLTDQVLERITDYEKRTTMMDDNLNTTKSEESKLEITADNSMMTTKGVAKWFKEQGMTYITGYV